MTETMHVVTTKEARESPTGCYHIMSEDGSASLCGGIKEDEYYGEDTDEALTQEAAE